MSAARGLIVTAIVSSLVAASGAVSHGQTPPGSWESSMANESRDPFRGPREAISLTAAGDGPEIFAPPGRMYLPAASPSPGPAFAEPMPPPQWEFSGPLPEGVAFCPPGAEPAGKDEPQYPTVRITGFFQADWGWIHQDPANIAAVGDVQDGADFRRARLAAVGDVADGVGYTLEMDFAAPGRPSFMDVWFELKDPEYWPRLRVGYFRHPVSMSGLTSVRELVFLERALPFAFIAFRQIGAMVSGFDEYAGSTYAVSVFRFPTDVFGGNVGDNGGYGMASRFTSLLLDRGEGAPLLHFGAAYSFGDPSNDRVRYRAQPEFFLDETGGADLVPVGVPAAIPPFVDTGPVPASMFHIFGVEAAGRWGSAYFQSEWLGAVVNQIGRPRAAFSGAYAQAAYLLTGEVRPYNRQTGVFGRVSPAAPLGPGGWGAWETALRWSYIDLNDGGVTGGRMNNVTWGLNWYLNRYTKVQFNYIHAFLDSPVNGESDAGIYALRGQLDF